MSLPTSALSTEFASTSSPGPIRTLTPMSSFLAASLPSQIAQYGAGTGTGMPVDQTSPEAFRQNIILAREQLANLQNLAQSALYGVENAYQAGIGPAQTAATIVATIEALKSTLEFLRQTGVGALPGLSHPVEDGAPLPTMPSEQDLLASTNAALTREFERNTRVPESAGMVANMLAAADRNLPTGSPVKRTQVLSDAARTPA